MAKPNEKRILRVAFILNGFVFLMSGISLIAEGNHSNSGWHTQRSGTIKATESKPQKKVALPYWMNIVVALTTSISYFMANKTYLPYIWLLITLLSLLALVVYYRKERKAAVSTGAMNPTGKF